MTRCQRHTPRAALDRGRRRAVSPRARGGHRHADARRGRTRTPRTPRDADGAGARFLGRRAARGGADRASASPRGLAAAAPLAEALLDKQHRPDRLAQGCGVAAVRQLAPSAAEETKPGRELPLLGCDQLERLDIALDLRDKRTRGGREHGPADGTLTRRTWLNLTLPASREGLRRVWGWRWWCVCVCVWMGGQGASSSRLAPGPCACRGSTATIDTGRKKVVDASAHERRRGAVARSESDPPKKERLASAGVTEKPADVAHGLPSKPWMAACFICFTWPVPSRLWST